MVVVCSLNLIIIEELHAAASIFYRHISFLSDLKCILPVSFLKVCITNFMFVSGIGSKCSRYIHSHSAKRIVPPHSYSCNYKKASRVVLICCYKMTKKKNWDKLPSVFLGQYKFWCKKKCTLSWTRSSWIFCCRP